VTDASGQAPPNLTVADTVPESAADFDISDPELLRTLEESQKNHFWFRARNLQILQFLARDGVAPPAKILEVGCGSGTVLSALADAGYRACGLEMHRELATRAAVSVPRAAVFCANVFTPPAELRAQGPFDAVGFFDVLEHLAQPERVLHACARMLVPGGLLVGTLPALKALWSDYDAYAGHRLRYDRRALDTLFRSAGLAASRADYFFQALLPAMLVRRAVVGRRDLGQSPGQGEDGERRRRAQHRALDVPGALASAALAAACGAERAARRILPLGSLPGASLWFSARVAAPQDF
jgi:2-polyprenyl-3-methyl-5-hydroxy-6-metoxy-1,4-benzoquinol methylase